MHIALEATLRSKPCKLCCGVSGFLAIGWGPLDSDLALGRDSQSQVGVAVSSEGIFSLTFLNMRVHIRMQPCLRALEVGGVRGERGEGGGEGENDGIREG